MSWIRVDTDLAQHPKLRRLATRLGCSKVQAFGHIVALWTWAGKFAPHGDTDKFEPEELADAAMFDGDAGRFVAALKEVELIDADGMLHDWQHYNGKIIEKRENDRERMRTVRSGKVDDNATVDKKSQDCSANVARTSPDSSDVSQVRYGTDGTDDTNVTDETKKEEDGAAPETALCPAPVIMLPTNTANEFPITEDDVTVWSDLYRAIDVMDQLRRIRAWLLANADHRKTHRGMMRFVNRWLSDEHNKARSKSPAKAPDRPAVWQPGTGGFPSFEEVDA